VLTSLEKCTMTNRLWSEKNEDWDCVV